MPRTAAHLPKWKKGQSGNPKGPPKNKLAHAMKKLTASEFADIANLIVKGKISELKLIAKDETQSALRVMLASVAIKIINKGDMSALDTLLNRLVGKVTDKLEHTNPNGPQVIVMLPPKNPKT